MAGKNVTDQIPDSTILSIFSYLDAVEMVTASAVCKRWLRIARDEQLWKRRFLIDFHLMGTDKKAHWLDEYRRFADECPKIAVKKLTDHKDQVLHVSFSHSGSLLATCSKDGTLKVWTTSDWTLAHDKNLHQLLYWKHTLCSKFNETDRLLLVSGLRAGESTAGNQNGILGAGMTTAIGLGELAVFEFVKKKEACEESAAEQAKIGNPMEDLVFRCRAINEPYDVYGCWYDHESILNGQSRRFNQTSTMSDTYFLHAACEQTTSTRLFQFYNPNGGVARNLCVSSFVRCSSPGRNCQSKDKLLIFTTGHRMDTPHQIGVKLIRNERITGPLEAASKKSKNAKSPATCSKSNDETKIDSAPAAALKDDKTGEKQIATEESKVEGNEQKFVASGLQKENGEKSAESPKASTSQLEKESSSEDESEDEQDAQVQQVQIRVHTFDRVDRVIETHGRIMGLALSPDQRYIFVHVRPFVDVDCMEGLATENAPLLREYLEIRVIDLQTLSLLEGNLTLDQNTKKNEIGDVWSSQTFFIDLDVNDQYILSGGNESASYLWDRHHECLIRSLPHEKGSAIHSVAFHPKNSSICASASGDGTVVVWYSKAMQRAEKVI